MLYHVYEADNDEGGGEGGKRWRCNPTVVGFLHKVACP